MSDESVTDNITGLQFYWPAQAKGVVNLGALPGGKGNWYVLTRWLRGHEWRAIEIIVFPIFTGTSLDEVEKMLAAVPGVYRIARIVGGSFGRERGDKRRQVRALMAVNGRALQDQPLGRGGWSSPRGLLIDQDVVVYDPRNPSHGNSELIRGRFRFWAASGCAPQALILCTRLYRIDRD